MMSSEKSPSGIKRLCFYAILIAIPFLLFGLRVKLCVLYYAEKNLSKAAQCLEQFKHRSNDSKTAEQLTALLEQAGRQ